MIMTVIVRGRVLSMGVGVHVQPGWWVNVHVHTCRVYVAHTPETGHC